MPAINLEVVIGRLEQGGWKVKADRQGFKAYCPAHGDTREYHLYLKRGDRSELVLYCFKGCAYEEIMAALGFDQRELFLPGPRVQDERLDCYTYRDADGRTLFQECRYKKTSADGEVRKGMFLRRPDPEGSGWMKDMEGITPVPYRLPELVRANPAQLVLYAEGAKCAEFLAATGYPVTATAYGAGKARRTPDLPYWLQGRLVAIFPDFDEPGKAHAREVESWLNNSGFGIRARIVPLPDLKVAASHGEDVVEWVEVHGHTLAQAINLAERALAPERQAREAAVAKEIRTAPPSLAPEAFLGVTARLVDALAPVSEAELAPLLVNFLLAWGCMVGRGCYARVGATRHHLNEFALLVGPTGGGKGSSWSPVFWLLSRVEPAFAEQGIHKGLSSGEGLVALVRDRKVRLEKAKNGNGNGKRLFGESGRVRSDRSDGSDRSDRSDAAQSLEEIVEDEGVADKRKLVVEEEFFNVLAVMRRQGNTLSARLREAWDDGRLEIVTKERTVATNAHVGVIGHITPEEMREKLSEEDAGNGFGNRFLLVATRLRQLVPHGARLPEVNALVAELRCLYEQAQSVTEIGRTRAAAYIWEQVYGELKRPKDGLFGKMVERRAPHVLRLSAIYATLMGKQEIGPEELLAALAVWTYCEKTAWWLFGSKIGIGLADRILTEIKARTGGVPRTVLYEVLGLKLTPMQLDGALEALVARRKAYSERKVGNGGREVELWFAAPETGTDDSEVYLKKARAAWEIVNANGGPPVGWEPAETLEWAE